MSDEYIKKADAIEKLEFHIPLDLLDDIKDIPSEDVEPVVRCKDCKWWTKQEKSIQGRCALTGTYPTGGWYCANGERKDND